METSNIPRKRMISISCSDNLPQTSEQISNPECSSSQEYSISQQTLKLFVGSWNVGGIPPPYNLDLNEFLDTRNTVADIYVLGFQEIVPLNAGNIFVTENSNISMKWNSLIGAALNKRIIIEDNKVQKAEVGEMQRIYPLKTLCSINSSAPDYECIISKQMVVASWGAWEISHLASGGKEGDERHRNTDVENILARTLFAAEPLQLLPRKILDHDRVIWLGDLNYRIYLPMATTRSLVKDKEWSILLENDQLKAEMSKGRIFEDWKEKEIEFPPTYKYNQNSDEYYGSNHKIKAKRERAPAWCDRIIWFGEGLKQIQYNRVESRLSDHRPVRAMFTAYVKVSQHSKEPGSSILSN